MLIDLDDITSYPADASSLATRNAAALLAEEMRLQQYHCSPRRYAEDAPPSPATDAVMAALRDGVADRNLLVHHATRLDAEGLRSVQERGLRGFEEETLMATLHRLAGASPALQEVAHRFEQVVTVEKWGDLKGRYGRLCLSATRSEVATLSRELLRYGGECVQVVLETIDETMELVEHLAGIGQSYVIQAALPIAVVDDLASDLARPMLGRLMRAQGHDEWSLQTPAINIKGLIVPPAQILAITAVEQPA